MSEVRSRPQVHSVSSVALTAAAAGGVILAAHLARLLFRSLSAAGRRVSQEQSAAIRQAPNDLVQSVTSLREQHQPLRDMALAKVTKQGLKPVEALQVSTLLNMAATPFRVEDAAAMEQSWGALQQATDIREARFAQRAFVEALESGHQKVFVKALSSACRNAALRIGFDHIEITTGSSGEMRVIANDPVGRTLVAEIHTNDRQDTSLKTEVVNVLDDSCSLIHDAFDQALEKEGVRASKPKRKYTGGVCELAAAREFVRKKVRPQATQRPAARHPSTGHDERRRQRSNQTEVQILRQRDQ